MLGRVLNFLLKRHPVETYLLLLVPLAIAVALELNQPLLLARSITDLWQITVLYFFLGGRYLIGAFMFIYAYASLRIAVRAGVFARRSPSAVFSAGARIGASSAYLMLILGAASFTSAIIINQLSRIPTSQQVAAASHQLMNYDYQLFGAYLPFWLQQFSQNRLFDFIALGTYKSLGIVLTLVMLVLLATNTRLYRQFITAFYVALLLALPTWYLWPAISPSEMYRQNILTAPIPSHIQSRIAPYFTFSPAMEDYLASQVGQWSKPEIGSFAITHFPSMHAAWGIIIAYFGIMLWRPLALALIPWSLFNLVGTVYTLHHYAIDSLLGILVAVIAIILANYLLKAETKYRPHTTWHFALIEMIQQDVQVAKKLLTSLVRTFAFGQVRGDVE